MAQDDGLPLLICSGCSSKLVDAHSFRITCLSAADFLNSIKLKQYDVQATDTRCGYAGTKDIHLNFDDTDGIQCERPSSTDCRSDSEIDIKLETKPDVRTLKMHTDIGTQRIDIKQEPETDAKRIAKKSRAIKAKKIKLTKEVIGRKTKPRNRLDVCEICGVLNTNMASHRLVHEQNRTIECDYCSRKFSHKNSLALHFKIHMNYRFEHIFF